MKLNLATDSVGASMTNHNRALQNPPVAVPHSGLPSHQNDMIDTEFLLVCEAHSTTLRDGRWRFVIEAADGAILLEADDSECGDLNRLTLLAAVRGLESLDGPSSVTLMSKNRYLIRSLSTGLPRWRQNDFHWDHFGRRVEVQNADLWRRIDHTLGIHHVQACLLSTCLVSRPDDQTMSADQAPPARRISRIDAPAGSNVPPPSRPFRRLLQNSHSDLSDPTIRRRRGRFTAEDLAL
ncbi:MAG: ribonuclease HI [Planctomycetota bacterium]